MGKVIDINRDSLEAKSEHTSIKMKLSEDTLKMVDEWYPILEKKGLVENKTQAFSYLARLGSAFLEHYKQGKKLYVGEDKDHIEEANIIGFLHKLKK